MPTAKWINYSGLILRAASGNITNGERQTYTQIWEGKYADAYSVVRSYPRGALTVVSICGDVYNMIVDNATVTSDDKTGSKATLTINYTFLGSVPPPEWSCPPFEIQMPIERNPFFSVLTQAELQLAKGAFNANSAAGQSSYNAAIGAISNSTHQTLVIALVNKWLQAKETYYRAGAKLQYSFYCTTLPATTLGGVIQYPSSSYVGSSFVGLEPAGLSWLRQADDPVWNNGLFKVTRTWLGGPDGTWDTDLYPTG